MDKGKSRASAFIERYGLMMFIGMLFSPDFIVIPFLGVFAVYLIIECIALKRFKWSFFWLFVAYALVLAWMNNNTQGVIAALYIVLLYMVVVHFKKSMTPSRYNFMQYQVVIVSLINFFFNFMNMSPSWAKPITDLLDTFIARGHLPQFRAGYFRAYSTFDNPNIYAFVLMIVLLVIFNQIELQIAFKRYKEAAFYGGAFLVNSYALVLTQTRSIWIALGLGMIVILIAQERWTQLKVLIFLGSLAALVMLMNPELFPRFSQMEDHAPIRFNIWQNALSQIKKNPYFGQGFFTYPLHFDNSDAHNIFIDVLLNFGILGTLILGVFIVEVVMRYLKDAHPLDLPLAVGLVFATVIYGIFDIPLYAIQPSLILTMLFILPTRKDITSDSVI